MLVLWWHERSRDREICSFVVVKCSFAVLNLHPFLLIKSLVSLQKKLISLWRHHSGVMRPAICYAGVPSIDMYYGKATKVEWFVTSEWSPDGCYFMTTANSSKASS
ncbi:hypothetical protein JHK85_045790 [Glycine max]|nr:hypothetical protein JHK85_045790 [Glycine max]